MQEFWSRVFLNNTLGDYAIVMAVIFVAYLLKKFIGRYVTSWVFLMMKTMGRQFEKQAFVDMIVGPMQSFLFIIISYIAIKSLSFPEVLDRKTFTVRTPDLLEGFGEFLIIIFFFKMLLKLAGILTWAIGLNILLMLFLMVSSLNLKRIKLENSADDNFIHFMAGVSTGS